MIAFHGIQDPIPVLETGARTGTSTTDPRAGIGIGKPGDPMFTIQSGKQHAVAYGGNRLSGPLEVATAVNAHGGPHGRQDFESETFIAHSLRADGFDASEEGTGRATPLVIVELPPFAEWIKATASLGGSREEYDRLVESQEPLRIACGCGTVFFGELNTSCPGCGKIRDASVTYPPSRGGDSIAFNWQDDRSFRADNETTNPLRANQTEAIAFSSKDHGGDAGDVSSTIRSAGHTTSHANAGAPPAIAMNLRGREGGSQFELDDLAALRAANGGSSRSYVQQTSVRRLTPLECERLMGVPDGYTLITYRGKLAADGPRYRALGNSMAVPCVRWIGERIQMVDALLEREEKA